jgi:hypothetical protein
MANKPTEPRLLGLTAQIVAAHAAGQTLGNGALPSAIRNVFRALSGLKDQPPPAPPAEAAPAPEPAVPTEQSVFPDYLVCLEDGKRLKMLKRHLAATYNMTPEQYRHKWGLAASYPMVAPSYAERRSVLAKQIGLGVRRQAAG